MNTNWRDSLNEGPEHVPEQKVTIKAYTTCFGCKYYDHQMVKSGMHPIYSHICSHPEAEYKGGPFTGNLQESYDHIVHTPDWCPFLKHKSNENEIPKES